MISTRLKYFIGFLMVGSGLLEADTGTETNLALNRAAYQSSAINYDDVAHLATDGSRDTFWQSKAEDQPWIYIDLGGLRYPIVYLVSCEDKTQFHTQHVGLLLAYVCVTGRHCAYQHPLLAGCVRFFCRDLWH